ncbi:MAG: type I-C CRISPR-associated endonuclease Cas1c, partial [Candidatus Krumholzibacteriia bacterium]
MKQHLNTLYVTTQGAYLSAQRETVVVRVNREDKLRIPLHLLEGVVVFGRVKMSPSIMNRCAERGVGVSFLSERGRFLAKVQGPVSGNVLLRREQFRRTDDETCCLQIARSIVAAKVISSRNVLLRFLRDHPEGPGQESVSAAIASMKSSLRNLRKDNSLESVRGIEGEAARSYFGVFNHLILCGDDRMAFSRRIRRPPTDPVNSLLSFLYTLLTHDVRSALEVVGLDPQVGFLHRLRPGRPSLALDLVEEMRAFVADRLALTLINRGQVRAEGFLTTATGAIEMTDETRKMVLGGYQEKKENEILHPFLQEKTTIGMIPHLQALLLARHLRGD